MRNAATDLYRGVGRLLLDFLQVEEELVRQAVFDGCPAP